MIVPQQPSWQLAVSRRLGLVCASLALIVLVAQASPPSEVSDASEQLEEWVPSCYPFCGMEVVVHKGYGLERHYATTPDGYILGLFRLLPRGEKSAARLARSPPLVLQHALLDSSFAWVSNYHKNQSLALLASDAGYDVWLGNNRGNVYSRNHTRLDPDADAAFWDFTFEDMATADLPATLRYILEHRAAEAAAAGGGGGGGGGGARGGGGGSGGGGSGGGGDDGGGGGGDGGGGGGKGSVSTRLRLPARSIGFIGHSEGTMQGFAGFSLAENAEVAEAVALFGALAPVAFLSGIDSPVVSGMAANHVDGLASWLGLTELLPGSRLNGFSSPLCSWVPLLCDGVLDLVTGASDNLNLTHLPVQLAHTPAGTSAKNLAHFMQGIRDGHFRRFDYGDEAENARRYNATRPPDFPLAAGFKVPVAMWSGARDSLATPADVARLQEALAPTGRVVHHAEVDFAHLDFTWSTRAAEAVYQPLLCMMRARLPPERGPCAAEAAAEPTPGLAAEPAAERRRSGVLQ